MSIVAATILRQLGGNRFLAMTGAKNLLSGDDSLRFGLKRGDTSNKCNLVVIRLVNDLYTIDFQYFNRRTLDLDTVETVKDVYADSLQDVFTHRTGLYTHL